MTRRRFATSLALMALSLSLPACNRAGHLPPGQVKHAINPPPGHTKAKGKGKKKSY